MQEPHEDTIWRYTGNGPCNRLVFRVIFNSSTEIVGVTESCFMGLNAGDVTLYSWLSSRYEFFMNFQFLAGPASTHSR